MMIGFVFGSFCCLMTCTDVLEPVGSSDDIEIEHVAFATDTTYMSEGEDLIAKGIITNTGSDTIQAPWVVEGQFFTNAVKNVKLGGDQCKIYVPLEPDKSTFWRLELSTSNADLGDYPDFVVGELRAVYED